MAPKSNSLLFVCTSVVATLGLGYIIYSRSTSVADRSNGKNVPKRTSKKKTRSNVLPLETVLKILSDITKGIYTEQPKEKQYEQALRSQYKDLPEEQYVAHLNDRFGDLVTKAQNSAYARSNVTAVEFEKACTTAYKSDENFLAKIQELKKYR